MKLRGLKFSVFLSTVLLALTLASASPPNEPGVSLEDPVYSTEDAFCQAYYDDSENEEGDVFVNWRVAGAEVYTQEFRDVPSGSTVDSYLDSGNFTYDQGLICEVVAENSDGTNSSMDDTLVQTDVPDVLEGPEFYNYSDQHAFNVSAVFEDEEGVDDMQTCWIEASGPSGSVTRQMELRKSYGDDTQAECFYSSVSNDNFDVLEELNVTVNLNDTVDNIGSASANNTVPNSAPDIFDVRPEDDSRTSGSEVNLQANFLDNDGENIDVKFYSSQASPETVCSRTIDEGTVSCEWENIESLQDYQWNINASDGYETVSQTFNFRNIVSSEVRAVTGFDHRYSSIMTSVEASQVVMYEVTNNHDDVKYLTSTVEGLNAEFVDREEASDPTEINYEVDPGETRELGIRINPEQSGRYVLNVSTVNEDFEISARDSIEAYVRDSQRTAASVPGIGLLQLIFLLLASTLYYSVRL